jgi:hypothetical protein
VSLINFDIAKKEDSKRKTPAQEFSFDHLFPAHVNFIGDPWEILYKHFGIIEQNSVINFWTFGRYAMHDVINYLLRQVGPCSVSACTWAITEKAVQTILNRIHDNLITDFRLWIDPRVKVRNPTPLEMCLANFPVVISPVHAKVALLENENWKISVSGSLNFTTNPQPERGVIQTYESVFNSDKLLFDDAFNGRTRKTDF